MKNKRVFKSKKSLAGAKKYRKWADWDEGDILICKLNAWHTDQYKKQCPVVEVVDAMFKSSAANKEFAGSTMVLNNTGLLMKALEEVEIGSYLQITYNGTSEIQKGLYAGKEAHNMDIELLEIEEEAQEEVEL
jgi:hypothetical protein